MHGETGAKLDSETSQIACEMKQTTPGKKNQKKKKPKTTQGPRKVSSKAGWHQSKKTETKQKQTHFSFCSTYFRLQMTKQHRES